MATRFPADFLNGTHPSIGLVSATFLAQLVMKDFELTEDQIHDDQLRVLSSVQSWLELNYSSKFVSRSTWDVGFAPNSDYWGTIINGVDDVVDALMFLRHMTESNWRGVVNEIGESRVYLALLLLALEHAAKLVDTTPTKLLTQYSHMAHKCVTELVLVEDGPFVGSSYHLYEKGLLKSAAYALAKEVESEAISKAQSHAAKAKSAKASELKQFAIDLYNQGNYASMRECASKIASQVKDHHDENFEGLLTTRDYPRTVQKWLSDAKKDGNLKY